MATLPLPQNGKALKGRAKKPLPSVDLTAMVDLAFLLITFFILTTSLSKMAALDIAKPVAMGNSTWPSSRTMTILLGKNNKAVYYMGEAHLAAMKIARLDEIGEVILANKVTVAGKHSDSVGKRLLVIIKPTKSANYKNFVDIVDEMSINGIETYAIDDKYILDQEKKFIRAQSL